MAVPYPVIGEWFRRAGGGRFEVVAIDEDAGTVEIQQFDGTVDELELDAWPELLLVEVSAPGDWSGAVDMDPDVIVARNNKDLPTGFHDPLAFLDNL